MKRFIEWAKEDVVLPAWLYWLLLAVTVFGIFVDLIAPR